MKNKDKKGNENEENLSEQLWKDVLTLEEHPEQASQILRKYEEKYAVGRLTISSFDVLWRFLHVNHGQPYEKQIKPYNFITVGLGYRADHETGEPVIPMLPYVSKDSREFTQIPYMPFTDYRTGDRYSNDNRKKGQLWTKSYWQPLAEVVANYSKHAEAKSLCDENTKGRLERRRVVVDKACIRYIGKETNKLEEAEVIGVDPENYLGYIHWKSGGRKYDL